MLTCKVTNYDTLEIEGKRLLLQQQKRCCSAEYVQFIAQDDCNYILVLFTLRQMLLVLLNSCRFLCICTTLTNANTTVDCIARAIRYCLCVCVRINVCVTG